MASCGLCNSFGRTKLQYTHDLAREHAETHFLQLKIIDDGITTDHIFEKCFPDFTRSKTSGRQDLIALCHTLFPKKSTTSSSQRVICEKCHSEIRITDQKKGLLPNVIIEHACYHLNLDIYECRHCVQEFKCRSSLLTHMATNHRLRTTIGHYRSKADHFVGEISTMIKACFGSKKRPQPNGITIRSTSISKIRGYYTKRSHLAVERQLFCHRLVRKVVDRNGNVQCRLCSTAFKVFDGKSTQCQGMKEHACCHLPTPLFRCRLCSEAYHSRSTVAYHLQSVHALPCLEHNFECLADQYHSHILDMMKKCYDEQSDPQKEVMFRNLEERQVYKSSTRSKLTIRRELLCRRLIRKCASAERLVPCRLCSKRISAKHIGKTLATDRVMQHALLHVGKELYQCKECSKTVVNRHSITRHFKKEHALLSVRTHYQCFADQFHDDIVRVLRQCYGKEGNEDGDDYEGTPTSIQHEPGDSTSVVSSRLTVERRSLCNQLTREHSDQKGRSLQCRLCNRRISVKGTNGLNSDNAMLHALVHLDKPIYRCKICSDTFVTRSSVGCHVTRQHAVPMVNNYDCFGDQFHAEIVEMLRKCYNKESTIEAKPLKCRTIGEASVRKNVNGSKQKIERQLFCHRLIRKFTNSDGNVKCRICQKPIAAMRGKHYQCSSAMFHAMVHLNKPIYRCVVCSERRPGKPAIVLHLKKIHALSPANNYEYVADEYHSEILVKLRECYGEL